jgi:1,4-dihydroxy-2-naphthoate octaprenyltransferase
MLLARLKDIKVIFTKIIGVIINQNLYFCTKMYWFHLMVKVFFSNFPIFLFISSQQDWFFFCFSLFKFVKSNNRFHNKDTPKSYIPSIINIEKQLIIWPNKNGLVSGRLAST